MVGRRSSSPNHGIYEEDGHFGLTADDTFTTRTPPISDDLFYMNIEGYAGFKQKGKHGNVHFEKIVKAPFSDVPLIFDNQSVAVFKQDGKYGFIHGDGKIIKTPPNEKIEELTERGYAVFYKSGKAGILKDDGTVMVEAFCDEIRLQSGSDRIWYKKGDLWGIAKISCTV